MEKAGGFGSGLLNDLSGPVTDIRAVRVTMREGTRTREREVLRLFSNGRRAMTPQYYETSPQRRLPCARNPHLHRRVHTLSLNLPIDHLSSDLLRLLLPKCKCKCTARRARSPSSTMGTRVNLEPQKRLPYASKSSTEHHAHHTEILPTATTHAPRTASSPSPRAARGNSSFQSFSISPTWAVGGTGTALAEAGNAGDLYEEL